MATLTRRLLTTRNCKILKQLHGFEITPNASRITFIRPVSLASPFLKPKIFLSHPQICSSVSLRCYSDKEILPKDTDSKEKQSLLQRFKQMYRDYWYVLVPVHLVTSVAWFGGFYYMAKSGVDIVGLLESLKVSEKITNNLKDSTMGYIALSYALYKVATPLRYTVTLGGTTVSINYLKKWGYIKPVLSTNELKVLYKEQKENIIESIKETKEKTGSLIRDTKLEFKLHKEQLKDQKNSLVKDIRKGLKKIKKTTKLPEKPST